MMLVFPLLALLLGALIAYFARFGPLQGVEGQYLAVACLAGFDTVFGGIRSGLEGKFRTDVFITGFISNVLIASFLAWLGDQIYINMFLAVALALGGRIFTNLSLIRRFALTKWQDGLDRKRLQAAATQAAAQAAAQASLGSQPEPNR